MSEHGNDLRRFLSYEATSGQDQAGPKFRRDVFSGVLLFIDISGYSAMANNFACMGEVGVELLSNLLNGFLTSQVIASRVRANIHPCPHPVVRRARNCGANGRS